MIAKLVIINDNEMKNWGLVLESWLFEALKFTPRARHGESGEGDGLSCPMTETQRLHNAAIGENFNASRRWFFCMCRGVREQHPSPSPHKRVPGLPTLLSLPCAVE